MSEFQTPAFLQNKSVAELYAKIKDILPDDLDLSEGGHGWNLTRPVALMGAEICEYILPEVIKLILPEWSYGEFLEAHARRDGIYRKSATAAEGEITITGTPSTVIPAGSLFAYPSVSGEPSVDYATKTEVKIPESGSVKVGIVCTEPGVIGNTAANTIVLIAGKITGITAVTNEKEVDGGADEETDEKLYSRISEYDKTQGSSFIGNDADYKRWAKSVPGVGDATVIPAEDDSGVVTIVITNETGGEVDQALIDKVYNFIMSPNDRLMRLAPIGAVLNVVAPETCALAIKATIELETGATIESVKAKFASELTLYLPQALEDQELKYSQIWAVLSGVEGVNDFTDLQIGVIGKEGTKYGTSNIPLSDRQLPTVNINGLELTPGTV